MATEPKTEKVKIRQHEEKKIIIYTIIDSFDFSDIVATDTCTGCGYTGEEFDVCPKCGQSLTGEK